MKITDRLVGDHKTFRKMLGDLDVLADQPPVQCDARRLLRLVELFADHLMLHAWCEDTFYYPVIRQALPKAPPPLSVSYMDHLDQEHKTVDGYLERLETEVKSQPIVSTWPQTYALFSKGLVAHMKKEEDELFPLSEKILGATRLEDLSKDLERRRGEAPKVRLHTRLA
jgi:hemerythrin-like domain-containing protein